TEILSYNTAFYDVDCASRPSPIHSFGLLYFLPIYRNPFPLNSTLFPYTPLFRSRITSAVPVTTIRSVAAQSSDRAGTVRLCSKIPRLLTPVSETLSLVLTPRTEEARESYEACPSGTWTLASRKTYMLQNVWARSSRPFSRTCSTTTSCPTPTSSLVIKETGVLL